MRACPQISDIVLIIILWVVEEEELRDPYFISLTAKTIHGHDEIPTKRPSHQNKQIHCGVVDP